MLGKVGAVYGSNVWVLAIGVYKSQSVLPCMVMWCNRIGPLARAGEEPISLEYIPHQHTFTHIQHMYLYITHTLMHAYCHTATTAFTG